ncbi:MAG: sulfotransferase, partial [Deltaproteobacteria bacterium]
MTTKDVTFRDAGLRSPLLRSVNAGGALLRRLGLERRPMRAEAVLARARKSTGLEDFGDDSWREGLDVLLESMEREADLTSFGRFVQGAMLSQFLGIRLQVVDWAKRHPAIREEKIRAPWVIAGLPRTGTTLLSHLLDLDPKVRSLLGWEATSPMPPATPAGREHDPRIAAAEKIGARLDRLIPPLKAMHPLEPRLPTECVTIFACDFRSLLFTTQTPVPAYAAWLDAADTRPAYAF